MYYFSMLLVIIASTLYHISQKSINENASVGLSMIVTYSIALILSIVFFVFTEKRVITVAFKDINWASYLLGFSIFILEIGFLLVYRSGWNLNIASVFANVLTGIILVFIGYTVFYEKLSMLNICGIIISILGLILIKA